MERSLKNPSALARTNSKTGKGAAHGSPLGNAANTPADTETAVCEAVATNVKADIISCSSTDAVTEPVHVSAEVSSTVPSADESVKFASPSSSEAPVDCVTKASLIAAIGEQEKALDVDLVTEMSRQKDGDVMRREEPHASPVSSPLPLSSPGTTEVSLGPSPSPAAQSDTNDKTEDLSRSFGCSEASSTSSPGSRITQDHTKTHVRSPNSSPKMPSSSLPASANSSPSKVAATSPAGPFQLPALFSGLRVLKKGATGEDRETLSEIKQREKDTELAVLSLKKTVNKAKHLPEQITVTPVKKRTDPKPIAETKTNLLGQLNLLLDLDNPEISSRSNNEQESPTEAQKDAPKGEKEGTTEQNEAEIAYTSPAEKKKTSDLAYETLRTFLARKTPKKEMTDPLDLDAVKKKLKNEKELLKSIFDRGVKSPCSPTSPKSPTEACVCTH